MKDERLSEHPPRSFEAGDYFRRAWIIGALLAALGHAFTGNQKGVEIALVGAAILYVALKKVL